MVRFLGLCFDSSADGVIGGHAPGLVLLSFFVAALASYSALDMAGRWRSAEAGKGAFWLPMSGLTLGAGIWSMHFIAMTAFDVPMEQGYDPALTLLSGVIAILGAIGGLHVFGARPSWLRLGVAGVIVGASVATMHYVGMSALIVPAEVVYRPGVFAISILIALAASTAALWLAANIDRVRARMLAALVMAVAICGMHYTGMSGTVLTASLVRETAVPAVSKELLAGLVTVGVMAIVLVGVAMALLDRSRRLKDHAEQEAERLRDLTVALEKAKASAEAAANEKSRFLAIMSHEIRTPMNGVLGMLESVLRSDLAASQRDEIATARDSAATLLQILNDILDFSKIEAGQISFENISFDAGALTEETAAIMDLEAGRKGLELIVDIDPALPQWIRGDPTRFRQVALNLISNAVKFTETGEVRVSVRYTPDPDADEIRVEVRDTGIGIERSAQAKLFRHFSQADSSTTRRFGGSGLGLAICRQLVEGMGGGIGVDSEPGRGSSFWFTLPTRPGAEPELSDPGELQLSPIRPLRLLIAEDNAVNQKVLGVLLNSYPFHLTFVGDGVSAVAAVAGGQFDAVLMDVCMPVMDGPAATRAIRALPSGAARVPIIALTANAMQGDRETYLAMGMSDYVSKPIDIKQLLAAILRQCPGEDDAAPSAAAR